MVKSSRWEEGIHCVGEVRQSPSAMSLCWNKLDESNKSDQVEED